MGRNIVTIFAVLIFIIRGEEKSGPFSLDQVCEQLAEGNLQSDDLASHAGLEGPVPLSELMALVESAPSQEPVKDGGRESKL